MLQKKKKKRKTFTGLVYFRVDYHDIPTKLSIVE